jgi:hypothetical protein
MVMFQNYYKISNLISQKKYQVLKKIINLWKILLDFPDETFTSSTNHYIGAVSDDVAKRGIAAYFLNLKELADVAALMTLGLDANANDAEDMDLADLNDRLSAFAVGAIAVDTFNIARTS